MPMGSRRTSPPEGAHRDIGPGTLYRSIEQLIDKRPDSGIGRRPAAELDDERRRYYKLTAFGRRVVAGRAARLDDAWSPPPRSSCFRKPGGRDDGPLCRNLVPLVDARLSGAVSPPRHGLALFELFRDRGTRRP
mgnify:CR=1 FL=1